jgi:SpoVK/Ycf46/Vps4 family AAA+-type ATPase
MLFRLVVLQRRGVQRPKTVRTTIAAPSEGRQQLAAALGLLDAILGIAIERQLTTLGPASMMDPWRGMHLDRADVQRLLATRGIAFDDFPADDETDTAGILSAALRGIAAVDAFATAANLSDVDVATLLIALAPDVDLRYERIYAYLQDDITRKRPTADLVANLLARNTTDRLNVCARFTAGAPLVQLGMLVSQHGQDVSPLSRPWRVDELWRNWLLGSDDLPSELSGAARLLPAKAVELAHLAVADTVKTTLREMLDAARRSKAPIRVMLHGQHGVGKFALAKSIAREMEHRVMTLDLRDVASCREMRELLQKVQRASLLQVALLYIHGIARLEVRDPQLLRTLIDGLSASNCSFVLSCTQPFPALHASALSLHRLELGFPDAKARRSEWVSALAHRHIEVDLQMGQRIAERFSLSAAQIQQAAAEAAVTRVGTQVVDYTTLTAAVRAQCGTELSRMAQRIAPRATYASLVVPVELRRVLHEICARIATRDTVGHDWADGSVHARSVGVTALFAGPSGTGKTLAVEAVARELELDMYRIDLAGIVSKYIGETEKNLDRVFAAAQNSNAVLFFDEADALFGKRSEVKDAHDRYANIEVAYLLQKMEQFSGLAILATNLKQNLDEAFARRLTFTVNFPFPEANERRLLWEQLWPPRAPRGDDIDLAWFAQEFKLSGGNIRNAVMAAAHLAVTDGRVITRDHLLHAIRREFQKLGKNLLIPAAGEKLPL